MTLRSTAANGIKHESIINGDNATVTTKKKWNERMVQSCCNFSFSNFFFVFVEKLEIMSVEMKFIADMVKLN